MTLFQRAVGIDLSPTYWRAVYLEVRPARTQVLGSGDGAIDGTTKDLSAAIEEAVRTLEVSPGTRLGIALARPIAHLKRMALPKASRARILEAIGSQSVSLFPMGKERVVADVRFPRRAARRHCPGVSGLVAATPADLMESLASRAHDLGLQLTSADLRAGAIEGFLRRGTDTAALLHDTGVEWVKYARDGTVIGPYYYPLGVNGRQPSSAGCTVLDELPGEVSELLRQDRVVLLGPQELLKQLGAGESGEVTGGSPGLARRGVTGLDRPEFVPACGAALQALGARSQFDLRPESLRNASRVRPHRRRLALVGIFAFSIVLYAFAGLLRLRSEVGRLKRSVEHLAPQAEEVLRLRGVLSDAEERAELLATLVADQPRWSRVLAELTRVVPADAYLTSLRDGGERLHLEGYAVETSEVVSAIQASPMFESVRLAGPVTRERSPLGERERFTVELVVVRRAEPAP